MPSALKPKSLRFFSASPAPAKRYFVTMFLISYILLAVFTLVIYQQSQINEQSTRWVIRSYEILHRDRNLLIHMYDSDAAARNYVTLNSPTFLATYKENIAKMDSDLGLLTDVTVD